MLEEDGSWNGGGASRSSNGGGLQRLAVRVS